MNEEDHKIVDTMEKFGGSFVQSLAMAFRTADRVNFLKLKRTFSSYWEEYRKMSKNINEEK